jgi:predicted permease
MNTPQSPAGRTSSRLPAALRRVLAVGAVWVPRSRRQAWIREWEAELYFAANDDSARPRRLMRRALWSHLDALWIFQEELTMTRLLADIRLAVRSLQRSPTFTVVAVLTLALGIGANTAIFSVVNGVLLKPLPYPDSGQLLSVNFTAPGLGYPIVPFSDDLFVFVRDQQQSLAALAMYSQDQVNLVGEGDPAQVSGARVTPSLFDVLQVPAAHGRTFTVDEGGPGGERVAVIAYELWQQRYGGDPDILDRTEEMDGVMRRIVGVMPAGFTFPGTETRIWKPYVLDEANLIEGSFGSPGIGRMAAGVQAEAVVADFDAVMQRAFDADPDEYPPEFVEQSGFAVRIVELKELVVGDVRQALLVVLGTVGLVLLIACANVGNLFLVRAETRQREVTLRAALGAGRGDIARFFLAESLILSLAGGTLGVILAAIGVRTFINMAPVAIPRIADIAIDVNVLAFTLGISVFAGLLFGMIPMLRRQLRDLAVALRAGGRSVTAAQGAFSARNILVVAQVALALVLLVGSGLMMRSFQALRSVDPGFDADGVLAIEVALPGPEYPDAEQRLAFWTATRASALALPGVTSAGVINNVPMGFGRSSGSFAIEGYEPDVATMPPLADKKQILPGALETLGVPLIEGRFLNDGDGAGRFRAALVSENLARHWWPDQSAIGARIRDDDYDDWFEIVGVVGDVHNMSLEEPAEETIYYPGIAGDDGAPEVKSNMSIVLRTTGPTAALVGPMRDAIHDIDPRMPIARSDSMANLLADTMARTSFTLVMLGIAAAVALLLGAIGIYGVISYVVNQRLQEIGVRIALGASRASVQNMVVRRGMILASIGIAIGLVAAFAATSVLGSLLYEIDALDPVTYATVAIALATTALLASWIPALRASGVDPVVALRAD